jgi:histidinol-phosphate phosphatase family protein
MIEQSGMGSPPIVFLDKDGTLIEDLPYNVDPRRVRFTAHARDALQLWARHGWRIAIATNQSGVARGYFTWEDLEHLAAFLRAEVEKTGATWAGFYACPHLPDGVNEFALECRCRKPLPGLLVDAAAQLDVDARDCWFIGDTWMDMAAGRAAGCHTILVGPDWRQGATMHPDHRPDHAAPDLLEAARIVVEAGPATHAIDERSEGPMLAALAERAS